MGNESEIGKLYLLILLAWNSEQMTVVRLTLRRGYMPKVLSTLFRAQVIMLQAFDSPDMITGKRSDKGLLCPVRALRACEQNQSFLPVREAVRLLR